MADDVPVGPSAQEEDPNKPTVRPTNKVGVLMQPSRLSVRAVLDAGSGAGSGACQG